MPPDRIRIGLSGWRYRHWRGTFSPPVLPQRRELEHVATLFATAEINRTFYSLQRPAFFERWAAETPEDFLFALKGGRFITDNDAQVRAPYDAQALIQRIAQLGSSTLSGT